MKYDYRATNSFEKASKLAYAYKKKLEGLGHNCKLSHVYELIAFANGFRNWATMKSVVEKLQCKQVNGLQFGWAAKELSANDLSDEVQPEAERNFVIPFPHQWNNVHLGIVSRFQANFSIEIIKQLIDEDYAIIWLTWVPFDRNWLSRIFPNRPLKMFSWGMPQSATWWPIPDNLANEFESTVQDKGILAANFSLSGSHSTEDGDFRKFVDAIIEGSERLKPVGGKRRVCVVIDIWHTTGANYRTLTSALERSGISLLTETSTNSNFLDDERSSTIFLKGCEIGAEGQFVSRDVSQKFVFPIRNGLSQLRV